ncbi:Metabotropic glutamate receptor 4 [Seminavis robusta]|uniref:Metabotropic glutamate receptor 4 n=1 Tax=Seminavis robusta TaxID=568900 RepID=A0A9N8H3H7_9STRA|nr:Metabotropic glutamate receptor 4 [Seminavis robusta]|eukprot:Sro87_g046220.1 Metabotropic glutamate receptor 4 (970) ;mRNA; f:103804-106739
MRRIPLFLLPLLLSLSVVANEEDITISTNNDPSSYGYYEQRRLDPSSTVERHGNLDLVHYHPHAEAIEDKETSFPLCHLATFLGFSRATGSCDFKQASKIYKELVATEMAIHHFNNGLGTVVPEIQDIQERCPLKLSATFLDSQYTPPVIVKELTRLLTPSSSSSTTSINDQDDTNNNNTTIHNNNDNNIPPCAVIGARTSSSTGPSSIVSGAYGLPQMSFTATSPELNDAFKYPLFGRVVPADDAAAKGAMRFLKQVVQTTHVNVLYINDAFGNHYHQAFQKEAEVYGTTAIGFPIAFPPDPKDIQQQLSKVKQNGVRHVLMVFFSDHLDPVMRQAVELGIAGQDADGYFWMLGISTSYFGNLHLNMTDESDAALAHAIQGMAVLPEFGAKPNSPGYDRFAQAWQDNTADATVHFNQKMPTIRGVDNCFEAGPWFFQDNDPGSTAHFAYDTVISMGLGACAAMMQKQQSEQVTSLDGETHIQAIINATFEGASGNVQLDPATKSRDPLRFSYAILNVLPNLNETSQMVKFDTPEVIVLTPNQELTDWDMLYLDEATRFVFHDGTSNPPPSLPPITVNKNYIGQLRILGYCCFALIAGLSIGFTVWTFVNRNVKVVIASQPFYLMMVSVGTLILGSILIPLSMDDQHYSQQATDAACMAQPWLGSIGFVTAFTALASKMRRIDQLLVLKTKDVLIPYMVMMGLNLVVLVCWTIMAPLKFVRKVDDGTDPWNRVVSSAGSCRVADDSIGGAIPYILALAAINVAAVLNANVLAFRTRHMHTQYSESRWIGLIMLCLLQSWLTGIPIIGLLYEIPQAHYVVITLIVTFTSLAILLLIFVPKISYTLKFLQWQRSRENGNNNKESNDPSSVLDKFANEPGEGLGVYRGADSRSMRFTSVVSRTSMRSNHCLGSVHDIKEYLRRSEQHTASRTNTSSIDLKTTSCSTSFPVHVENATHDVEKATHDVEKATAG